MAPNGVDPNWPKPISALPGHEKWTFGAVESVFAENPNRVFILARGEIPKLTRPEEVAYPSVGPSLSFPVSQVPWRNASVGPVTAAGNPVWSGKLGVDARWEHCIVVVDANGNMIDDWTMWGKMLRRPHSITMNPYDPEKHIWVVDDQGHAVYEFTHDGKELVKTLGTPYESGEDEKHFNRPTFINWLPDGTMFVTDGYGNTRVVKFDKDGKYLMAWGTHSRILRTILGQALSMMCMAWCSIFPVIACSSRTAPIIASKSSTKTENFSISGRRENRPRRSTSIMPPTVFFGSPTASPRRSSSSTWTAIFTTNGAAREIGRAHSGTCTA